MKDKILKILLKLAILHYTIDQIYWGAIYEKEAEAAYNKIMRLLK